MRILLASLVAFAAAGSSAGEASADREAAKYVGVGVGLGATTGLNAQLRTGAYTHVGFGLGTGLDTDPRVHADLALRLIDLHRAAGVFAPIYVGVGLYYASHDDRDEVGARFPVGVQADFASAPLQVFGELTPEVRLASVDASGRAMEPPRTMLLTGMAGVRAAF